MGILRRMSQYSHFFLRERERRKEGVKKAREGVKKWEYFERERERTPPARRQSCLTVVILPTAKYKRILANF